MLLPLLANGVVKCSELWPMTTRTPHQHHHLPTQSQLISKSVIHLKHLAYLPRTRPLWTYSNAIVIVTSIFTLVACASKQRRDIRDIDKHRLGLPPAVRRLTMVTTWHSQQVRRSETDVRRQGKTGWKSSTWIQRRHTLRRRIFIPSRRGPRLSLFQRQSLGYWVDPVQVQKVSVREW